MDKKIGRPVTLRGGLVAMPFAVFTLYLNFSRWPNRWFTEASDFAGLGWAVASGICFFPGWQTLLGGGEICLELN